MADASPLSEARRLASVVRFIPGMDYPLNPRTSTLVRPGYVLIAGYTTVPTRSAFYGKIGLVADVRPFQLHSSIEVLNCSFTRPLGEVRSLLGAWTLRNTIPVASQRGVV